MQVSVNGRIVSVLEKREGVSKAGTPWQSQDYVIMPDGDEDFIAFNVFGADKIAQYDLHVGSLVSVTLSITSREYNGKYYPQIRAVQCYSKNNNTATTEGAAPAGDSDDQSNLPF